MTLSRLLTCNSRPAISSSLAMEVLLERGDGRSFHLRPGWQKSPPVANLRPAAFHKDMRAIWSGSIAFGLVNVPVKAYTAVREHDLKLHKVHDIDHGRIK